MSFIGKKTFVISVVVLVFIAGAGAYIFLGLGGEEDFYEEFGGVEERIKIELPADLELAAKPEPAEGTEPAAPAVMEVTPPEPAAKVESKPKPATPTPEAVAKVEPVIKAVPPPVKPTPVKPKPKPKVATRTTKSLPNPYAINVASFRTRAEAERFKAKLIAGGYNTYVTEFVKDGILWFRVRVGFYPNKEYATSEAWVIAQKFKRSGGWVVRPATSEVLKHTK